MKNCNTLHLLIACLLLSACSEQAQPPTRDPAAIRTNSPSIEETYARLRSQQVRDVDYTLSIDLSSAESFSGTARIEFDLVRDDIPLTIDFDGGDVTGIHLNGQSIAYEYNDWFITIASAELDTGRNIVSIEYTHPYSKTGAGLYRFTDPQDGRVYVYTDFEPYNANNLFPSFDQPDLKAGYSLDVIVPATWQVVSATPERDVITVGETSHWYFPQSARFSTYIFSLHAGEYALWEADAGAIPLRLFARQSLKDNVIPGDWFEYTRQGLVFFQDYFGVDYPFIKYDLTLMPVPWKTSRR
jgi:aminopeptidase N